MATAANITNCAEAKSEVATALTLADLNTKVNHEPRVSHRRLAGSLGYEEPHKLGHLIERHRSAVERFGIILSTVDGNGGRGRPGKTYWLNKRQALYLCTKSEAPLATETTIQMVEVFDAWQKGQLVTVEREELLPGLMRVRVGRREVMVDLRDYRIGPGDDALVFGHQGKVEIMHGPLDPNTTSPWLGARSVNGHWKKPGPDAMRGTTAERGCYSVIGRLVKAGERRRRQLAA